MGRFRNKRLITVAVSLLVLYSINVTSFANNTNITNVLQRLEKNISTIETIKADFIQEKTLAVFNNKLKMSGEIYMKKPSMFAWHLNKPIKFRMIINNSELRQWDEESKKVEKVNLEKNPMFLNATKQMQIWFSGNYSSLISEYDIKLMSEKPAIIQLTPLQNNMTHNFIKDITVSFRTDEKYVQSILIVETSGDRTLLRFINTKLNSKIPEEAWQAKP